MPGMGGIIPAGALPPGNFSLFGEKFIDKPYRFIYRQIMR
jgi:hypothetical protein